MLENKQGMVSKYKTLNQTHKKTMQENQELAAELAKLKAGGQRVVRQASQSMESQAQATV